MKATEERRRQEKAGGQFLKRQREKLERLNVSITQEEIADALDVSQTAVSQLEKTGKGLQSYTYGRLKALFDVYRLAGNLRREFIDMSGVSYPLGNDPTIKLEIMHDAGTLDNTIDLTDRAQPVELKMPVTFPPDTFFARLGDALMPELMRSQFDRDAIVFFDPSGTAQEGEIVLYEIGKQAALIRYEQNFRPTFVSNAFGSEHFVLDTFNPANVVGRVRGFLYATQTG